ELLGTPAASAGQPLRQRGEPRDVGEQERALDPSMLRRTRAGARLRQPARLEPWKVAQSMGRADYSRSGYAHSLTIGRSEARNRTPPPGSVRKSPSFRRSRVLGVHNLGGGT